MRLFVAPLSVLVVQTRRLAWSRACAALRRRAERKATAARTRRLWGAAAAVLVAGAFAVCTVLLLGHGDVVRTSSGLPRPRRRGGVRRPARPHAPHVRPSPEGAA
jgi:hypothetical protein